LSISSDEVGIANNTVDVILSVTVLDHIMSDSELIKTLRHFKSILNENGAVIAFEYSLDNERPKTSYQRFMKLEEWRSTFLNCGFYLHRYYGFYHPVENPCESYLSYRSHIRGLREKVLRLFSKYVNRQLVDKYLNRSASKNLQEESDFFWQDNETQSPIKIMIFRKVE